MPNGGGYGWFACLQTPEPTAFAVSANGAKGWAVFGKGACEFDQFVGVFVFPPFGHVEQDAWKKVGVGVLAQELGKDGVVFGEVEGVGIFPSGIEAQDGLEHVDARVFEIGCAVF